MSLRIRDITYTYPGSSAPTLKGISFGAEDGDVVSVIGANGAGKSTLLKNIIGFYKGGGEVWIDDLEKNAISHKELHNRIGYMPQESALLTSLSVWTVVLLGRIGTLNLKVQEEDIKKTGAIIDLLGLNDVAERPFYALSGGQRRVVDVAQTLVRDPSILIMDEPTSNLDLVNELQVLELVKAYTKQKHTSTLLTLHDLNLAARYSDKLILLKDGTVFRSGPPEEVITEENIREAYGVEAHIHVSSRTGTPMVLPLEATDKVTYNFLE